ncbi:MAG TPA: cysteine--tRNA ligase [Candidatus Dormibacteraeota bacterium]
MSLRLHDTMSRRLQEVVPLEPGHVRLYTCGPTVWNRAHIGNFRTFVFEDVLRRVLEQRFEKVTHVMNLTDVDDRILNNARSAGHTLEEETGPWINAFFEDLETLGIRPAHQYPRATEYIDEMVSLIERLEGRQVTYRGDGSTYFRIAAFPPYGRLTGLDPAALRAGASGRIDADDYSKEDARDFALWKAVSPEDIGWETRLGRGHPGWHIECSAMSMALLGESFDLHCGGVDNMFPHHENEIAQSEAATGKRFVQLWVHANFLNIDDTKMSKRLGNITFLPELVREYRPSAVRFQLAAAAHYRKLVNFSFEPLAAAAAQVEALAIFRDRVSDAAVERGGSDAGVEIARDATERFDAALDEDLNLPLGVGELSIAMRAANRALDDGPISRASQGALLALLYHCDDVIGVLPLVDREREAALDAATRAMLDQRVQARAQGDYALSDRLRAELRERGIVVDDTSQGQRWRPAS